MASQKEQETLESLPWYGACEIVEEFSHSGVAVFLDKFPVNDGHMLFVPIERDYGLGFCFSRAHRIGSEKVASGEWDGFNVGMNVGTAAGQTIDWPHIHLIPRHRGDVTKPAGGIRGVIPSRRDWKTSKHYAGIRSKDKP